MSDQLAKDIVAAVKRLRQGKYGPVLHLLVPRALPDEVNAVLAQLDVKPVVWAHCADGYAFLLNVDEKKYWQIDPPYEPFKMPDYGMDTSWLWPRKLWP